MAYCKKLISCRYFVKGFHRSQRLVTLQIVLYRRSYLVSLILEFNYFSSIQALDISRYQYDWLLTLLILRLPLYDILISGFNNIDYIIIDI